MVFASMGGMSPTTSLAAALSRVRLSYWSCGRHAAPLCAPFSVGQGLQSSWAALHPIVAFILWYWISEWLPEF